jgi:hypothetical protein
MPVDVCSLKVAIPQLIQPDTWTIVRFPFDATGESTDTLNMHSATRPAPGGPVADWSTDDRSGLIWPSRAGWGELKGIAQWAAAGAQLNPMDATEYRDQFVRNPLSYAGAGPAVDTTATDHRPPTPGGQFFTKSWGIFVDPTVPLAMRVYHNASEALNLTLAEFKLSITY